MADGIGHRFADQIARRDAPVDFRQAEYRFIGGNRQIAGHQRRECAAEAPAVHHRNGGLGVKTQHLPLPFAGFAARFFLGDFRLAVGFAEVFFQIHAGRPRAAFAGNHHHADIAILLQRFQYIGHFAVEGWAHRIAFFGAVERHPSDLVLYVYFYGLPAVFIRHLDSPLESIR